MSHLQDIYNDIMFLDCTVTPPTDGAATPTTVIHGSTTTYSCTTAGYTLDGTDIQTCNDGSLSDSPPTCEAGKINWLNKRIILPPLS